MLWPIVIMVIGGAGTLVIDKLFGPAVPWVFYWLAGIITGATALMI